MKKHLVLFGLFLLVVFSFSSCKKKPKDNWDDTMTSGFIRIAADESFRALMDAQIRVFEGRYPNAVVIPIYTNETEAIRLLVEDSVRFALTTRDLNSRERAKMTERNMFARKYLIAFDGIALITNPLNPDSIIGIPTLRKILTGEITEWSQINPDSHLGTIRVIFDNQESGVLRYAVDSLLRGDAHSPNLYALNNGTEVIDRVAGMPNAIGMIGVNVLSDNTNSTTRAYRNKIRMMRVSKEENATLENSYLPYAGSIVQENYPLWRPVYVLLSDPRSGLSSGLTVFLANEIGQKIVLTSGLLPITDPHIMRIIVRDEHPK
jgi:phosphate transport system substrate-binding protein